MAKEESNKKEAPKKVNPLPWITGILFVLGLAVLGGIYWDRTSKVEQVLFEGVEYVNRSQLQQQVDIPIGINPDSLNFIEIIHQVETIDYVEQASINMQVDGSLVIHIKERQPVALLINGQNRAYVDRTGLLLPHVPGPTPNVPILYGFSARPLSDTLESEAFETVSHFLQELQKRPASDATISEVAWTKKQGVIALTRRDGVKLIFGKKQFDKRLRNWEAFYAQVIRQKGLEVMEYVNLSFNGQIVSREQEE